MPMCCSGCDDWDCPGLKQCRRYDPWRRSSYLPYLDTSQLTYITPEPEQGGPLWDNMIRNIKDGD